MYIPNDIDESVLMTTFREDMKEIAKKTKDPTLIDEVGSPIAYPTTFLPLDYLNGENVITTEMFREKEYTFESMGICKGSLNMVIGNSGTAKSTWAVQSCCSIMQNFFNKATGLTYYDLEGGMSKSRIRAITGWNTRLIERLISLKDHCTSEQFFTIIKNSANRKIELAQKYPDKLKYFTGIIDTYGKPVYEIVPSFVILDSLPMLRPADIANKEDIGGNMDGARTAKMNNEIFSTLTNYLKKANIIIFVINHITKKLETNMFAKTQAQVNYLKQDESIPGGTRPLYLSNAVFKFTTVGAKDPDYEGIFGFNSKVTMIKNRKNRAGQIAPLVYDQQYGFNRILSAFELLIQEGYVHTGQWAYFDGLSTRKFRRKTVLSELENDYKLREYMKACIKACGSTMISNSIKNSKQLKTEGDLDSFLFDSIQEDLVLL